MLRTEVIRQFLNTFAQRDLAMLYTPDMECQVNVGQDGGERVEGDYQGHHWTGWTDGIETWKSFRIPWRANSDPEYIDKPLKWSTKHIEAVGMTGWDWKARASRWVGFDFDSVVGHVQGLSAAELDDVKDRVSKIDWVTVRRSKGGLGLHLYVMLDPPVPTENHTVHAALARAILSELSGLVGVNLFLSVDKLGGNLWVWHRETKVGGFTLVKVGEPLRKVPENWRDHLGVVEGKHHRVKAPAGEGDQFEDLVSRMKHTILDVDHMRLIDYLRSQPCYTSWDSDRNMLVTHTSALAKAHRALKLKGIFYTLSEGKGGGGDKNCFMFPVRDGAWVVRRFGLNAKEHAAWQRDANGWTRCLYNHPAELAACCAAHEGIEDDKGAFNFKSLLKATACLKDLGAPQIEVPEQLRSRSAAISSIKNQPGKILLRVKREDSDDPPTGWLQSLRPKGEYWQKVLQIETLREEPEPPDETVRHVVSSEEDAGWFVRTRGGWMWEPRQNVTTVMKSLNYSAQEVDKLLGLAILNPWSMVAIPFQDEYPGGRRWNRNAPQLAFTPKEGPHPTWDLLINHVFKNLTAAVLENPWCKRYGVSTGGDYGRCWIAAMLQEPRLPLPYLFFVGPQKSGKSTLHEAIKKLFLNGRGVARADQAMRSRDNFNGELVNAILAVIEEISLRKNEEAYNRIKDLTTAETISIHFKGKTIYDVENTLHFMQCANSADACPVQVGDTRIVMIYVDPPPGEPIAKPKLMERLVEEASGFLYTVLHLELPPTNDRLRLPVVETAIKEDQASANRDELEVFLQDYCHRVEGWAVQITKFYEAFFNWLPLERHQFWNQRVVKRKLPPEHPTGRYTGEGQIHIGNVSLVPEGQVDGDGRTVAAGKRLERRGERLAHVE